MANRLSDDELRNALLGYGEDVGPITPTTRSTWERKLVSLRRTRGHLPKNNLNAFSSDDSEIETSSPTRKKRTHNKDSIERSERLSLSRPSSDSDNNIFKKPTAIHVPTLSQEKRTHTYHRTQPLNRKSTNKRNASGRNTTFDMETSDSDFDSEGSPVMKSPRSKRKPPASNFPSDLHSSSRVSDEGTSVFRRKSIHSSWNSEPEQSPSASPTLNKFKIENSLPHTVYQSNGYLSTGSGGGLLSNGDFPEETEDGKGGGKSTNYSHCISWLLLLGAVVFFLTIGALYWTEIHKTSQSITKSNSKFCSGVREDQCKSLILVSRELHHMLTNLAGEYECGTRISRNMTVWDARAVMRDMMSADGTVKIEEFDEIFDHSISLFKRNSKMGVKCHPISLGIEAGLLLLAGDLGISALEAEKAAKSLGCRLRLSLRWTATKLLLLLGFCLLLFLSYLAVIFWRRRREAQEKIFYEMVEKVIDVLQEPSDSLMGESSLGCCKAVVNVRDVLIPAKERKEKLWLWERVVSFIEENESRVSVEYQKINGEDFKVWRWNPYTTASPENESGKQGKVWQGQAFSSLGKGKNAATYTPSPCLKIRNMFDPEVEYGEDWKVSVRDAILEKCEGNDGIVHIAFDTSTNNEGCVFMMCSSSEAAGQAYNDLHGWWFDGKLVTVKYLKQARYLQRFPESEQCRKPLRPSNNKRLSLSTPFFSSALERS